MLWRMCPSWPEYEVSDEGLVRRVVPRKGHFGVRKSYRTAGGYLYLVMRGGGERQAVAVHRLVAEAFLGPPPPGRPHVAHRNGDKTDNRVSNLRWSSRSENESDKVGHGVSNRGTRHYMSRLTEHDVLEMRRAASAGMGSVSLAEQFGVSRQAVTSAVRGRSWAWLEAA